MRHRLVSYVARFGDPKKPAEARTVVVHEYAGRHAFEHPDRGWSVTAFPGLGVLLWRAHSEAEAIALLVSLGAP